jgi:hypothetical protein
MSALVFVVGFCVVAVLVYMGRFSGRLRVSQTRMVDAPLAEVYGRVADFAQWCAWSPWLEHVPAAETTTSPAAAAVGSEYGWDSAHAGAGRFTHLRLQAPTRIEQRMAFRQPFRFRGRCRWQFAERGAGRTEVTWSMRGRVGFATRAFADTVQGMVALDFRYGLDRLAAAAGAGHRPDYTIDYLAPRDVAAARCAGVVFRGPLDRLAVAVPDCVATARAGLAEVGGSGCGDPVAIYLRTRIRQRTTECLIGLPVGDGPVGDLTVRELPAHRAAVVRLRGDTRALEIAWYQAMQRMRIDGLEPDLRIPPFERYRAEMGAGDEGDDAGGGGPGVELHIAIRPPAPPAAPA